jgi:hypothetical protein
MHEALSRQLFDSAIENLTPELCASLGWRLIEHEYPVLDVEFAAANRVPIRVRLTCDAWNSLPPAVSFHSSDGTLLTQLPISPENQFNNSAHPSTGRPFLCMIGAREYHQHSSHITDLWDNYRDRPGYDLGGILAQIHSAWRISKP